MISMRVCSIHPKNPHPISNKHAASSPYLKPKWFKSIKQFQTIKGVQKPHPLPLHLEGCKEKHFNSLPFGQAEASIY